MTHAPSPTVAARSALGLLQEPLIQRNDLFERPSFHGAAAFHWAGAQPAFSSPIDTEGYAVMNEQ
jgi:hypothetical protein